MTTRNEIRDWLVGEVSGDAPEWTPRESDPVWTALDRTALVLESALLFLDARERAHYVQHSTGADMLTLAAGRGISVQRGTLSQSDADAVLAGDAVATERLRTRTVDALAAIQPSGNLESIEAAARGADADVAQALAQPDYAAGTAVVYLLARSVGASSPGSPLPGTPPAAMLSSVESAITARDAQPAAFVLSTASATLTEYTIAASVDHDGTNANVEAQVRAAVYASADAQRRLGRGVRTGLIVGAIFSVEGVTDVSLTAPTGDLAPTGDADAMARTAFSVRKDETNVSLAFALQI